MKRLCAVLLFAIMLSFLRPSAYAADLSAFQKVNHYSEGQFVDVSADNTYARSIQAAYEYGILYGTSGTCFDTDGNLTFAQAIAMSCRLHSIYCGSGSDFTSQSPWYQSYVEYARQNNIISPEAEYDFDATIDRANFAVILNAALPDEALPEVSRIENNAIPDVWVDANYYDAVYRLYRAGILVGNSSQGEFTPSDSITRAQAAVIVSRMADPSLRANITLTKADDPRAGALYDLILAGVTKRDKIEDDTPIDISSLELSTQIDGKDRVLLHQTFRKVIGDHPELIFTSFSYIVYGTDASIPGGYLSGIKPYYYEFASDRRQAEAELEEAVERALAQVEGVTDPAEKAHILHDYMVLNCSYDPESAAAHPENAPQYAVSAYGALVKGDAICQGYALGYKLLMDRVGIECVIVYNKSMDHCWNLVKLGDNWYHVDVTWDDPIPDQEGVCQHNYLLLSDAVIRDANHHHLYPWYACSGDSLPLCEDTSYETIDFHQR